MNPFELLPISLDNCIQSWQCLYVRPYDKHTVHPHTRARILLMQDVEAAQIRFSHWLGASTPDAGLRRKLSLMRRLEQQQHKKLCCLRAPDEGTLEEAVGREQLAVELACALLRAERDKGTRRALRFTLVEDFDHLYRIANLLSLEEDLPAARVAGGYTEILPGRPTIEQHRHPFDAIRHPMGERAANLQTRLSLRAMAAAQQGEMDFYARAIGAHGTELGRRLLQEIGMVEEQHATEWESALDPSIPQLERLLLWQYAECYLYYSCHEEECDPRVKGIWAQCFEQEVAHLQAAARLAEEYAGADWRRGFPSGEFPPLVRFQPDYEAVREALAEGANLTAVRGELMDPRLLPEDFDYFDYQRRVNTDAHHAPSSTVLERMTDQLRGEYRFEMEKAREEALTPGP